jgi:hypothetical protein
VAANAVANGARDRVVLPVGPSDQVRTLTATAFEFAEILDDSDTLYWAGATLFSLNVNHPDRGGARAEAERLLRIADRAGDPAMIAAASRRIGYLQHLAGEFREAQRSIERALRFRFLMDDQQPAFWTFPFHHVSDAQATLSEILLMRGFAERALHDARSNLDELNAEDRLTSVHGLLAWGTCRIAVLTGDLITADQEIPGLIELSARMGSPF